MEKNYYTNTRGVCRWHNSPNIVGHCGNCGAFMCEKCSLPTQSGIRLCPNCFRIEYSAQINEIKKMKKSAIIYTVIGVVMGILMMFWIFYRSMRNSNLPFSIESFKIMMTELYVFANESILISILYICLITIVQLLFFAGFLFGLRKVINKIRSFPQFSIVISILFFFIIFVLAIQIAWIIGIFVMISDYKKIYKKQKLIDAMEKTYNLYECE